jgi:hypothetical protein
LGERENRASRSIRVSGSPASSRRRSTSPAGSGFAGSTDELGRADPCQPVRTSQSGFRNGEWRYPAGLHRPAPRATRPIASASPPRRPGTVPVSRIKYPRRAPHRGRDHRLEGLPDGRSVVAGHPLGGLEEGTLSAASASGAARMSLRTGGCFASLAPRSPTVITMPTSSRWRTGTTTRAPGTTRSASVSGTW